MLTFEKVSVSYGRAPVLFDIDLEVGRGELVAILGSNGAGKSTTLRAASGVVPPRAGRIVFDGEDITTMRPHQIVARGMAHCPEGRRLFSGLTVEQNLHLGARSKQARKAAASTLEEVYTSFPVLKERRSQMAGSMSGGEQQMCAIGRALMAKPKLLLLDEPSLGLAPIIIQEVFAVIRQVRELGVTVLIVEQNVSQTLDVVDRAYVIEQGHVVLSGTASQMKNDKNIQRAYLGV
jgi:branched-chain amino acid transport system ATP-binding protein